MMLYSEVIRQLMIEKGLSQEKLARILHVNQTTVGQWLRGKKKPSYDNILAFYTEFGITPVLLGGCTVSEGPLTSREPVEGTVGVTMPAEVKALTEDNTEVRIIMQAWTPGENGTSGELAFKYVWNNRTIGNGLSGEPVRMIPGTYDILFWADRDADGSRDIYDAETLTDVKVVGLSSSGTETGTYVGGDDRDAFCGVLRKQTFAAGTALNVTLTRPLARVVVTNATELTSEMKVSLTPTGIPTGYNVLTGESLTESAAGDLTITYPNATPSQSEIFTDYFFPPATGSTISGTLTAGSHTQQLTLTSDDIVANYTTNITLNLN